MSASDIPAAVPYRPRLPEGPLPGVGIVGCGGIVRGGHLPAYKKYGVPVVGAFDVRPEAVIEAQREYGFARAYASLEELLADPQVQIVDIATHPAQRIPIVRAALAAGKHVLAQKPLAVDVAEAQAAVAEAESRGLLFAVNQNGRWAPAWRVATLLAQQGAIGEVRAVTHLFDMNFSWIPGTVFDTIPHFAIYDYAIHWFDISRCWLDAARPTAVRARDYRTPGQPEHSIGSWGCWVEIACAGGESAMIRGVGCAETKRNGHPFWVHGSHGTIRGSVLGAEDFVELERDGTFTRYALEGSWFPDGFGGTMGELMCAIAEGREPFNSARHNLRSLQLTLAACASADQDGAPVAVEPL